MEQGLFISALNTSIIHSVILGFIIYIAINFIIAYAPNMKAYQRYNLFYAGMILIFVGFTLSFIIAYINVGVQKMVFDLAIFQKEKLVKSFQNTYFLPNTYSGWIALIYLSGLFIQTLNMVYGFYRLAGIRSRRQLILFPEWDEQLITLCKKLNIRNKVGFYLGKQIFSPFTAGVIKPVIIFPIAIINRLSQEQVEAIILHELAHIKRNDYLWNIILKVMESMLFFNPFAWMLSQNIREEREFACDDLVVLHTSNPENYSRALLNLAESQLNPCAPALAASGSKYELFNRIKRINTMENLNTSCKHPMMAFIGIIGVCISIAWTIPTDTIKPLKGSQSVELTFPALPIAPVAPIAPVSPVKVTPPPLPLIPKVHAVPRPILPAPKVIDTTKNELYFNSAEWNKHIAELKVNAAELKRKFDSPEWKEQVANLKQQAEEMKVKFDSPEWKHEMEKMRFNAEEIKKKFESPEWKKRIEALKLNAEEMRRKFDNTEWEE